MCTGGHAMVQGFASNACGCMLRGVRKGPPKCVVDAAAFPFAIADEIRRSFVERP